MICRGCGRDIVDGEDYSMVAEWPFCASCFEGLLQGSGKGKEGEAAESPRDSSVAVGAGPAPVRCGVCQRELATGEEKKLGPWTFCSQCFGELVSMPKVEGIEAEVTGQGEAEADGSGPEAKAEAEAADEKEGGVARVSVGFATYITGFNKEPEERFVLGATGKFVRSQILKADNTVSADIGVLFPYFFDNRFQLGMSAQNIMGTLRYDTEDYPLPLILRLGSATKITDYFTLTADMVAARDNYPFLAMGGEFRISVRKTALFLRGGFNTRAIADGSGFRNVTLGTGVRHGAYTLDYSLSPFGALGSVHRISAGLNF